MTNFLILSEKWRSVCRFGRIVVGPPLHILNPKSVLFHSHVIFSFTSFTFFPFSMKTIIVLWDSKVDVLCKDLRKELHCPMGKNKKKLIPHNCPLKGMVKLFTKYIWWDIAGLYFKCNKKWEYVVNQVHFWEQGSPVTSILRCIQIFGFHKLSG